MSISNLENRLIQNRYFKSAEEYERYKEEIYLDALENNLEAINAAKDSTALISHGHRELGRTIYGYKAYLKTRKYDLGNIFVNHNVVADRGFKADLYIEKMKLDMEYDGTIGHGKDGDDIADMEKDTEVQKSGLTMLRIRSGSLKILPTSEFIETRDNQFLIKDQIRTIEWLNDQLHFWHFDAKYVIDYINNHVLYQKGSFLLDHEKDRLTRLTLKSVERMDRINKQNRKQPIIA